MESIFVEYNNVKQDRKNVVRNWICIHSAQKLVDISKFAWDNYRAFYVQEINNVNADDL